MSNFGSVPNVLGKNAIRISTWHFDASAGTVLIPGTGECSIIYIQNITRGVVMYNSANPATTATVIQNRYVKLVFPTSSFADDDELLIMCDEPLADASLALEAQSREDLLKDILTEMKVHSIYLHQLPLVLNDGTNYQDEPEILREELSNEK